MITEKALKLLIQSTESPFVVKHSVSCLPGEAFLRFDGIELRNKPNPDEGLTVSFMLGEEAMAIFNADRIRLENDNILTLQGTTGLLEILISVS